MTAQKITTKLSEKPLFRTPGSEQSPTRNRYDIRLLILRRFLNELNSINKEFSSSQSRFDRELSGVASKIYRKTFSMFYKNKDDISQLNIWKIAEHLFEEIKTMKETYQSNHSIVYKKILFTLNVGLNLLYREYHYVRKLSEDQKKSPSEKLLVEQAVAMEVDMDTRENYPKNLTLEEKCGSTKIPSHLQFIGGSHKENSVITFLKSCESKTDVLSAWVSPTPEQIKRFENFLEEYTNEAEAEDMDEIISIAKTLVNNKDLPLPFREALFNFLLEDEDSDEDDDQLKEARRNFS